MRNKALSLIEQELVEIKQHFDDPIKGGWELDLDIIESILLERLLGFDFMDLLIRSVVSEGFNVHASDRGFMIQPKTPYHPVYYDNQTNELVIIEDSKDKSYIFKYKSDRYKYLGKL